jgi:hypothetical protein
MKAADREKETEEIRLEKDNYDGWWKLGRSVSLRPCSVPLGT